MVLTFLAQIPLLILMVGAMMYHGMPGFVSASRGPALVLPKAQVEVPAPDALLHVAGTAPERVAGVGV